MESLAKTFREQTDWKIRFEKRKAEHEVIVARGTYTAPANAKDGMVDVFVEGRGGNPSTTAGNVGSIRHPAWRVDGDRNHLRSHASRRQCILALARWRNLSAADARKMLDNIEKQTGLRASPAKSASHRSLDSGACWNK